jgi:hypothetical protein
MDMYCIKCGYPIGHGVSTVCPECGQCFDVNDPSTFSCTPNSILYRFRWIIYTISGFLVNGLVTFMMYRASNIQVADNYDTFAPAGGWPMSSIVYASLNRGPSAFNINGPWVVRPNFLGIVVNTLIFSIIASVLSDVWNSKIKSETKR